MSDTQAAASTSEAGAGTQETATASTTTEAAAGQSTADGTQATSQETTEVNWQEKFESQQKVARDLEKKLKAAIPKDEAESLRAQLAAAQGKEAEYAETQKQREVEAAALSKANERILKAEVRALASKTFNDPNDALLHLDLSDIQVGDDGEVDRAVITERLEALAKSKPYLAAQGGTAPVFNSPTAAREGADAKAQWTQGDLKGKTPQQITAAKAEGLLDELLGSK